MPIGLSIRPLVPVILISRIGKIFSILCLPSNKNAWLRPDLSVPVHCTFNNSPAGMEFFFF